MVRHDQGGDTVSEGVSYALLLAQIAGDADREAKIWTWAEDNLKREDGLLSFRSDSNDKILDEEAATDADLVVAWALGRSTNEALRADAQPLITAIRERTVVRRPPGPLISAGSWATGEPATLNPSYWVLPALRATQLQEVTEPVGPALDVLSPAGRLPPDWARLDGSRLRPTPDPGGRFPQPRYGLDAQRTTVWLALDCDQANRSRAASHGALLADRPEALARALDGKVLDPTAHPLPLVAAAAAAHAGGDLATRDKHLDAAEKQNERQPTYYGAAWLALGRALLQTDRLDVCEGD